MNCKELVYLLNDYIDGTMEEHLRQEFSVHIDLCEPCLNFLKTYDKTRVLCRQILLEEIPEEVRSRLKTFVLQKAREHHREIEKYLERAARERREQVADILRAYLANQLSPTMDVLFRAHHDRCETCGAFLRGIDGGKAITGVPPDIEEHIAEFLDALPPGEVPTLP
jgi:anti-sigma factor RsiW